MWRQLPPPGAMTMRLVLGGSKRRPLSTRPVMRMRDLIGPDAAVRGSLGRVARVLDISGSGA
jgi:hypothetical protein